MEMKRRGFLTSAGTVGAVGLLLPTQLLAQTMPSPEDLMKLEDFQARLKTWLFLYSADAAHQGDLRLNRVLDNGSTAALQQFSLRLSSRRGAEVLPSGYYDVAGETFSLHIKHLHENKEKQFYVAEFALLM